MELYQLSNEIKKGNSLLGKRHDTKPQVLLLLFII